MSKRVLRGMRAIVTGASSGIGRELALELARRGASVCVTARREDRLRTLTDEMNDLRRASYGDLPEHFSVTGDVCDSIVRESIVESAIERFGGVDLLINNAGAGATTPVESSSDELACEMFDLNFFAPLELTKTALPALRASARQERKPLVVNTSSIVGFRGVPYYGVYGAAKSALLTLTDAWRAELSDVGIGFLTVMPGKTSSQFFDVLREDVCQPNLPKIKSADCRLVARAILNAAEKGKKRVVPASASAKLLYLISRFCPDLCDALMARFVCSR